MNPPRDAGVRLIVAYKLAKAVVQLLLATLLIGLGLSGYLDHARELALALRERLVHVWSLRAAELLLRALTGRALHWTAGALAIDGLISYVEGWALRRGYRWAPWLVVGATGALLPLELVELIARPWLSRACLLLLNAAIVIYLAGKARHDPHAH
jgi:uncharacterized membrane protein (DUF2068 family)